MMTYFWIFVLYQQDFIRKWLEAGSLAHLKAEDHKFPDDVKIWTLIPDISNVASRRPTTLHFWSQTRTGADTAYLRSTIPSSSHVTAGHPVGHMTNFPLPTTFWWSPVGTGRKFKVSHHLLLRELFKIYLPWINLNSLTSTNVKIMFLRS